MIGAEVVGLVDHTVDEGHDAVDEGHLCPLLQIALAVLGYVALYNLPLFVDFRAVLLVFLELPVVLRLPTMQRLQER